MDSLSLCIAWPPPIPDFSFMILQSLAESLSFSVFVEDTMGYQFSFAGFHKTLPHCPLPFPGVRGNTAMMGLQLSYSLQRSR